MLAGTRESGRDRLQIRRSDPAFAGVSSSVQYLRSGRSAVRLIDSTREHLIGGVKCASLARLCCSKLPMRNSEAGIQSRTSLLGCLLLCRLSDDRARPAATHTACKHMNISEAAGQLEKERSMAEVSRINVSGSHQAKSSIPPLDNAGEVSGQGALGTNVDVGTDEEIGGKRTLISHNEPLKVRGEVERLLISDSGYFLVLGWLADEGCDPPIVKLSGYAVEVEIPLECVLRHARADVEASVREGAHDYGFIALGCTPARSRLKQPLTLKVESATSAFQATVVPELASDKRLLDTFLIQTTAIQSHAGLEVNLGAFLASSAGDVAVELFRRHVASGVGCHYVERFRPKSVTRSFVTVLFGSTEPLLLQPVLFRQQGIEFGEWIYVCNSPEDAETVLRLSRLVSDLYNLAITVIIMGDNVGFGAANNLAIGYASSPSICIINPDVFPLHAHSGALRKTLDRFSRGDKLCGGLLFYDDSNLMHSGMYIEEDRYFRHHTMNGCNGHAAPGSLRLLRVEHFDKGVPFEEERWRQPVAVPAITGAVMAFSRPAFERLGGFSTRYIYGHYEDADLSLRWAEENGPVEIDPYLRLIHLEGQGSRPRGKQYRGATLVNRYLFSLQHSGTYNFRTRSPSEDATSRER